MKKHILRIAMLAFALLTLTAVLAFTAAATDVTGGYIYEISPSSARNTSDGTKNVWVWDYHAKTVGTAVGDSTYTEADLETLYAHDSETGARVDTGLRYDFDSATGTLTIYPADGVDPASISSNVVWGFPNEYMKYLEEKGGEENEHIKYFKRNTVKNVIIDAEGLKALPEQSINQFSTLENITIPKSMTSFGNYSLSRCYVLKSVTVLGNERVDYTVDLRYLTYTHLSSFSETFSTGKLPATLTFLLGEAMCKQPAGRNTGFGVAGDANSASGESTKATGTIHVYTPTGETCEWVDDISRRTTNQWSLYPSFYDVYVFAYPNAVSELGYQVRTKEYNGLRAVFELNTDKVSEGMQVIDHGTLLDAPLSAENPNSSRLVEFGTIAGTAENVAAYGYGLVLADGEYVTANERIKKVEITSSDLVNGKFTVSVVNFSTKEKMTAPVFMCGYEIWRDENGNDTVKYTVDGGTHCGPTSLYEATVGMYKAGLINRSVEKDNIFWNVLEQCKLQMNLSEEDIAKNSAALKEGIMVSGSLQNPSGGILDFAYRTENGNLVYGTGEGAVYISIFPLSDGTYTAIAYPENRAAYFAGATRTVNWRRENHLSAKYIGVSIDTLIFDTGFKYIGEGVTSGFSQNDAYGFSTDLKTIIYADISALGGQSFHSDSKLTTVYGFKANGKGAEEGVADLTGLLDITKLSSSMFSSASSVATVKLPSLPLDIEIAIPKGFFQNASGLTTIYVDDTNVTSSGTVDFTGTGYNFKCEVDGAKITDETKTFENASAIKHIINSSAGWISNAEGVTDATECWRKSGNMWTAIDPNA